MKSPHGKWLKIDRTVPASLPLFDDSDTPEDVEGAEEEEVTLWQDRIISRKNNHFRAK